MCPDLRDRTFEVMPSEIALDKINLACVENVKTKPNGSDSGFINYSNTINVYSKWLYNSGYIITQW